MIKFVARVHFFLGENADIEDPDSRFYLRLSLPDSSFVFHLELTAAQWKHLLKISYAAIARIEDYHKELAEKNKLRLT